MVSYRRVHQEVQKIRYDRRKICLCLLVDDYFNILISAGASDSSDLIYRDRVYSGFIFSLLRLFARLRLFSPLQFLGIATLLI